MTYLEQAFLLIKTLDKPEKNKFSRLNKYRKNKSWKLYSFLDAQDDFQSISISSIPSNNIPRDSKLLIEEILKALYYFAQEAGFFKYSIKFLLKQGLHSIAKSYLIDFEVFCKKYELFQDFLLAYNLFETPPVDLNFDLEFWKLASQELAHLKDTWETIKENSHSAGSQNLIHFSDYLDSSSLESKTSYKSKRSQFFALKIRFNLHYKKSEFESVIRNGKRIVTLIESNGQLFSEVDLIKELGSLIAILKYQGQTFEADQFLRKLQFLPTNSREAEIAKFEQFYLHKLVIEAEDPSLEYPRELILNLKRDLKRIDLFPPSSKALMILFFGARICHNFSDQKTALELLQSLNQSSPSQWANNNFFIWGAVLSVLIQLELGDLDKLKIASSRLQRQILKANWDYQVADHLLYLASNFYSTPIIEQKVLVQNFIDEYTKLKQNSFQKRANYFFPFEEWAHAFSCGRPLASILRKQNEDQRKSNAN